MAFRKIKMAKFKSTLLPGQLVVVSLIFLTIAMVLIGSLLGRTAGFLRFGKNNLMQEQATNLAEAGVSQAMLELNQTAGSYTGESNTWLGTVGQFTVTVTNQGQFVKKITSTGYVPDSTSPRRTETVETEVYINTEVVAFNFAVQTGSGGINDMTGGSTINGNVWAGYKNGPVVNIVGSGNSVINGEAYATGTISSAPSLSVNPEPINRHPNQSASTAPDLPTFSYSNWKTAAGTTVCWPTDTISGQVISLGPCKQTGDLTISSGSVVSVTGPIWVTGNLHITGTGTKLKLDDSFGDTETVVLADGTVSIAGNATVERNSTYPGGYILLATTTSGTSVLCTTGSMCISGGTQTGIFYVLEGTASLSGGVELTGLVAKQILMSGGSTLNYDIGLASSTLTSGPGGSWQIRKGTYKYK